MLIPKPLILFIDAYDSFSNNIVSLLETTLNASVQTIKIDNPILATDEALHQELRHYVAVVCGPGPGHPEKVEDVGIMKKIWRLRDEELLPVLGICLGFQSLCLEFGGTIKRLKGPQHGMIRQVQTAGKLEGYEQQSIFAGVEDVRATLYQSLCADIGQDSVPKEHWDMTKWKAFESCPELIPLAWVESNLMDDTGSGVKDQRVLVAVQHKSKPFWALQYHPESICTDVESKKVIQNWFMEAQWWNLTRRQSQLCFDGPIEGQFARRESLLSQYARNISASKHVDVEANVSDGLVCYWRSIPIPTHFTVPDIVEALQDMQSEHIILESSNAQEQTTGGKDVRGRYSIIGLDIQNCPRFEYTTGTNQIVKVLPARENNPSNVYYEDVREDGGVWNYLAQYLAKRNTTGGNLDSPFWGGFMGYTTYELGLETIDVKSQGRDVHGHSRPDLGFAWVTQSLVIDHVLNIAYVQSLGNTGSRKAATAWMDRILQTLASLSHKSCEKPHRNGCKVPVSQSSLGGYGNATDASIPKNLVTSAVIPENKEYESKVHQCQEYIRAGDSYEICLTDQTIISMKNTPPSVSSWGLFKILRARQPAPFASYIRLGSTTLVSASPERFLKWDSEGKCELRPMKGTVRKSAHVSTLAQGTALLDVPKEKAENLMIVDLVRHDLHGVCGSGNVSVPRLMVVEEYKSVFQMISIVHGQIPKAVTPRMESYMSKEEIQKAYRKRYTGLDVLAASLPPGSMTGAPKKRSCEILQEIEGGKERSLYSGVVGYMDVAGRGDWSVTIRCMFRWDDEDVIDVADGERTIEKWHVGAGGAVTSLSTPIGEREEMLTKLNGTLRVFG